ncbi:MAG: trypsin-like serine protease, partial [Pseudomonadota bacterium]
MQHSRHVWASALVMTTLSVSACDVVKFPGAGPAPDREESTAPPPPPTTEVNPIPVSNEVLENADFGVSEGAGTDATVNTPSPIVTDLLTVNAARCAPTTAETLTFAEAAEAQPAAAVFTPQAVNGTEVTAADFPGIVKMEPRRRVAEGISSGHCGATRISQHWFVTAAHCLDNTYDEIELIATPSSLRSPLAIRVGAVASICHAAYGGATGNYANDIALVRVADGDVEALTDVPVARYGATASSLTRSAYPVARMAGWGLTSFGGSLSDVLLSAELDVVAAGPAAHSVGVGPGQGRVVTVLHGELE